MCNTFKFVNEQRLLHVLHDKDKYVNIGHNEIGNSLFEHKESRTN